MKILRFPFLLLFFGLFVTNAKAQIGNPAPDFTVTDTHGNTHTLYDYLEAGHVVVLDFFYTTCTPCQFYSPQVNLAYEKYGCNTQEVLFMSIDHNDTNAEVLAYDEEYNIEYPSVSGLEGGGNAVVSAYGIFGFPTFYVIDSSRTIIDQIDPPTLQVFDFRFAQHGILPAECTTGLAPSGSHARLTCAPNPLLDDDVYIEIPEPTQGIYTYEVLDLTGRICHHGLAAREDQQRVNIRLNGVTPGLYLVRLTSKTTGTVYAGTLCKL